MTDEASATPYDEIVYPDGAFAQSHPDRLAMLATLMGLRPAPVETARVLELGCAQGGNLIPMAYQYPNATFVGVDYAATQIRVAQETADTLRLSNLSFEALNFLDMDEAAFGTFDYILAHGIYSWVPAPVQQKMLSILKRCLKPQGVAYISYNVLPGWRMYGVGREMMMYRIRNITDPRERVRVAREFFGGIARIERRFDSDGDWPLFQRAFDMLLKSQHSYLNTKPDNFFVHDELEVNNEAIYFHEFMERAAAAGLQFLSESYFPISLPSNLDTGIQTFLGEHCKTLIELEQTLDFLRNRTFRQTLLVHDDIEIDRQVKLQALTRLLISSPMKAEPVSEGEGPPGAVRFSSSDDEHSFVSNDPITVACFRLLSDTFPKEYTLEELVTEGRQIAYPYQVPPKSFDEDATSVAANLLTGFGRSYAMVELRASRTPRVLTISERPQASAYARFQAIGSHSVISQRHEQVTLDETIRTLLSLLDGTLTIPDLAEAMKRQLVIPQDDAPADADARVLDEVEKGLKYLARVSLLVG